MFTTLKVAYINILLNAMRFLLLIIFSFFPCLGFGQGTIQIDSTLKTFTSTVYENGKVDSTTLQNSKIEKKKLRREIKKVKTNEEPVIIKKDVKLVDTNGHGNRLIIIGVLIFAILFVFTYFLFTYVANNEDNSISSKDEEFISDYLSRRLSPRQEYYRNVYLKSEEWKQKRYLVLERDNWRCVYCGGQATQVHHNKYAVNIGNEPIEWLVSICRVCHDLKHK